MKRIILLASILVGGFSLSAQEQERLTDAHVSNYRDWAISLGFGNTFMNGDLKSLEYEAERESGVGFEFGPTVNLGVTKYFSSVWGADFHFQAGQMSGYKGGLGFPRFESTFFNYGLGVTVNLSALALQGKVYDRKWAHIMRLGGGWQAAKPDLLQADGTLIELRGGGDDESFSNYGYLNANYNLKYRLSNSFDIDLNVGLNYFLSDIVDAYGSGIPNGVQGGKAEDFTLFTGLGVTYNFGNKGGAEKNEKTSVVYSNPLDDIYGNIETVREDYDKLTSDDDGDGVSNYFDADNSTPEGVMVAGNGKAQDADEDGIPDYLDEDPFTMKGAKVDAKGRAVDSDGDGVPDAMDEEANTPKGTMVNFKGQALPKGNGGAIGASLPNVYFAFNSATVTAANHYRLATIAQTLKANPDLKVKLVGFADKRGPEEYNKNLAMRRAKEVAKQLSQVYGIDESRLSTESNGESDPLANGRYDVNRRVDVLPQ